MDDETLFKHIKDVNTLSRFYNKLFELDRLMGNRRPEVYKRAGKFFSPLRSSEQNARDAEILEKTVDSMLMLIKSKRLQIKK